jgi:hypothetical protein
VLYWKTLKNVIFVSLWLIRSLYSSLIIWVFKNIDFSRGRWWDLNFMVGKTVTVSLQRFVQPCRRTERVRYYNVSSFLLHTVIGSALWVFQFCLRHSFSPLYGEHRLFLLNCCCFPERYPRYDPHFRPQVSEVLASSILSTETCSSETSVNFQRTTRHYIRKR